MRPVPVRVAVIIVGYNNPSDIENCLAYLTTSTWTDFGVMVCENGGNAACIELSERLGAIADSSGSWLTSLAGGQRVRLVCSGSNLGYAGAINLATAAIADDKWDYLWVLNPDTEPAPTALDALLNKAARDDCSIVGSRIEFADTGMGQMFGVRWRAWLGRGLSIGLGAAPGSRADEREIERRIDFVSGASMLVSRQYVEEIGPLAEEYFLYFEDADWCVRRRDHRLGFANDSIVRHRSGTAIGSHADPREQSPLSAYLMERNRILFTRRFHPLLTPLVALMALAFLMRQAMLGAPSTAMIGLRGWAAGMLGRTGPPPKTVFQSAGTTTSGGRSIAEPIRVMAIASGGGHWTQLLRLQPAFEGCDVVYVSTIAGHSELVPGRRFMVVPEASRWDLIRAARCALATAWTLLRVWPDVIITTGALPGFFAVCFGKVLRRRTVWIDSIANADELSMSGLRAGPFVDVWLTQWEHLAAEGGPEFAGSVLP